VSAALRWEVHAGAEGPELSLAGQIDERSDLDALLAAIPAGGRVQLGLSQVHRVSSAGALSWSDFMGQLKRRGVQVVLGDCSPCIVRQLNMSSQFQGHASVRSVYAPYYCLHCNEDQLRLIDLSIDVAVQIRAPLPCPTCGLELSLDEEEALYTQLET
jgi:anti-anti-sigma regulatory factor